ncbi:unnamed protein product [Triticum aestivum]|uniref:NAC domain-containing protein n=2 Tax=Triticinae TaxID=1648030 RepID=A0A7H4LK46_WHEAT|nr:uncharacterized protein LOC123053829 [Triticum aestivum]SPT18984.1 unnamed protein product [Triticum aestivum]
MATISSSMPADGCSLLEAFLVILLPLLLQCLCRPLQRGRAHGKVRWEVDTFGSLDVRADGGQNPASCNSHQVFLSLGDEDSTAGRRRAPCRRHPATTSKLNCRLAMINKVQAYIARITLTTTTPSGAGVYTLVPRRHDDDIELLTREGSGDDIELLTLPCVEESTASRWRAMANRHPMISERPAYKAKPRTSTGAGGRYRSANEYLSTSDISVFQFCRNALQHELSQHYDDRISIDLSIIRHWDQLSWWCTVYGGLDSTVGISEQWDERLWQGDSSEGIPMEEEDSRDCREQISKVSNDEFFGTDEDSCLDQSSVCSDSHTNAQCSSTMTALTRSAEFLLHRPMENSTLASSTMQTQLGGNSDNDSPDWIERTFKDSTNKIFRKDEDSCPGQNIVCSDSNIVTHCSATMTTWNSTMVSSSTQLGGSSDDLTSSAVEQPSSNNDDIVDSDSMNSSITTEHSDVSDEQATETSTEVDETSSTPWWLVPGFRFRPTDKEIVLHYLKPKVLNLALPRRIEELVNIYALDADDKRLDEEDGDKERLGFFFVHKQDMAYSNGCYYTTPAGYWRIRGRPSRVREGRRTVAFKTSMDFYRGRLLHGRRTPWSMFEYKLNADRGDLRNLAQPEMNSYIMCKVRKRDSRRDAQGGEVLAAHVKSKAARLWRHPAPLPGSPSAKQNSRRRIGQMDGIVAPERDVILLARKQKEAMWAPELEGDEPGVLGKRKRPATF